MRFAHVIFDCDGVLVDTESIAIRVETEIFRELGYPLDQEEIARLFTGKSADYQADWLEARIGRDLRNVYEDLHAERMLAAFREGVEAIPGVKDALQSITAPKSVATNGIRERATYSLTSTGLLGFFDGRLNTVEDVKHPKPAPDLYLLAAAKAGVDPASCVVIEDSATGVTAAHAAGMTVIGFTGSAHDRAVAANDLNEAGAHILLEDMRALHTALDWL
jgi:HAD superfamily hydrolase (TIGR01509 family)